MNICRLCLGEDKNLIQITEKKDLLLKIKDCVSVEIKADDNTKSVCNLCIQKVENWHSFKQMCINSDIQLKEIQLKETKTANFDEKATNSLTEIWSGDDDVKSCISEYEFDDKLDCFKYEHYNDEVKAEPFQDTYQCEICLKNFDACIDYLDHQDEHNGQSVFKCDKCKEVFTTRLDLVDHEKKHKKACPKCGKMVLKASMRLHLVKHSDRYVCETCSIRCNSRSTLQQHIITVHTDIKNHVCETCGKCFSSKTAINVHLKIHQKERGYACQSCNYAGRTASALYIHMSKHAKETHCCEVCAKIFKSARNLKDHLRRVHSKEKKHQCTFCNKKFVDKYMMTVHMRTHTGVRPYKCNLCDKAFIRSDSLKEHVVTHGSRKLYPCKQCLKKFTTRRGFRRHSCIISPVV